MGYLRNLLAVSLAVLALSACAKTSMQHGGSSETHFLALCNASCDEGYSCLCGVCTEACSDDDACEAFNGDATCQVGADGCGTQTICDVECANDDDCDAVGAQHTCDGGRCRAPLVMAVQDAGAGPPDDGGASSELRACTTNGVAELLAGLSAPNCGSEAGATRAEIGQCVNDKYYAGEPFFIKWSEPGEDSLLERGIIGTEDGAYEVYFDSLGFGAGDEVWMTSWVPCTVFRVGGNCDALDSIGDCLTCSPASSEQCGCGTTDGDTFIDCSEPTPPACAGGACLIDGVCYPDGETTEDGCCTCSAGVAGCIDPAWCPSWPLLGRRCEGLPDCQLNGASGLECHTSQVGPQRNICTRACNFGCPTGTECAQVEAFGGELCVRTCQSNADCNIEVFGEPLGSECVGGYCL